MIRLPPWLRVCGVMFAVGWGANQFSSLLLAYKLHRGLSDGTGDALFGVYALGLIPALLVLGPISDRRGRRAITLAAGIGSGVATVLLMVGDHALALLYLGRLLAGVCSGAAFAAGTAWVKELSQPPYDTACGPQAGARRPAIALSAGFGFGPLVAGLLAQWAPDPLLVAYLPHLLVVGLVLGPGVTAPETVSGDTLAAVPADALATVPADTPAAVHGVIPGARRGVAVASARSPRFSASSPPPRHGCSSRRRSRSPRCPRSSPVTSGTSRSASPRSRPRSCSGSASACSRSRGGWTRPRPAARAGGSPAG